MLHLLDSYDTLRYLTLTGKSSSKIRFCDFIFV